MPVVAVVQLDHAVAAAGPYLDPAAALAVEAVGDGVHHDVVDDLFQVARIAVHLYPVRYLQVDGGLGAADDGAQRRQAVLHRGAQVEGAAALAGLVHGDPLEAFDQFVGAVAVAGDDVARAQAFVQAVQQAGAGQPVVLGRARQFGQLVGQGRGGQHHVADRRVQFVRHARHQHPQRGQLFRFHDLVHGLAQLARALLDPALELLVEFLQGLFDALALRQVDVGADHAQRLAGAVAADQHAVVEYPLPAAVAAPGPVFLLVAAAGAGKVGAQGRLQPRQVVRVDQAVAPGGGGHHVRFVVTVHAAPARREQHLAAGDVPVPHAVAGPLQREVPPFLGRPQGLGRSPVLAAPFGFLQFARHGRAQPGQVALHHVIVGAGPHQGHGRLLADGVGDDDEGQVQPRRVQLAQGDAGVQVRQVMVGQHDVPARRGQRGTQVGRRFHPVQRDVVAGLVQATHDQVGIAVAIFHQQDGKRGHGCPHGASFSTSQYKPSWRTVSENCAKSTGLRM